MQTSILDRNNLRPLLRRILLVFCLALLYVTNVPFEFDLSSESISEEWREKEIVPLHRLDGSRASGADLAVNFVLFVPLGLIFYVLRRVEKRKFGAAMLQATLAGAAFSLGIEILQVFSPPRYTSINDLIFNTLGAAAGAFAGHLLFRQAVRLLAAVWSFFRRDRCWGLLSLALVTQVVIALAPFHFEVKTYHLIHQTKFWLASWSSLFEQIPFSSAVETFILSSLITCLVFILSARHAGSRRQTAALLYAGVFALYPVLTAMQLVSRWRPQGALFLLAGMLGVLVMAFVARLLRNVVHGAADAMLGRVAWGLVLLLALCHVSFSHAMRPSTNGHAGWLHAVWLSPSTSSAYLLHKLKIVWFTAPAGYLLYDAQPGLARRRFVLAALGLALALLIGRALGPASILELLDFVLIAIGLGAGLHYRYKAQEKTARGL